MTLITTNYQYHENNYNVYVDATKDMLYSIAGRTITKSEASVVAKSI